MCYVKPGPRCAAHLTERIGKIETKLDALTFKTFDGGATKAQDRRIHRYRTQLEVANFEFDGTKTGQKQLDDRIRSATSAFERKALVKHKDATRKSRMDKLAAYHRTQERLKDMTDAGLSDLREKLSDRSLAANERRRIQRRINAATSLRYQKEHSDSINSLSKSEKAKDRISKLFIDSPGSPRPVGLAAS